jgi:glycosyltransferase involved in cell wall biosynthesis
MTSVCALVPVYDHERAVGATVASLRAHGLAVILVDDGSGPSCAGVLRRLAAEDSNVHLLRLAENQGKGAAVMAGLRAAADAGFTHALQIDADGQHDSSDVPRFVAAAGSEPRAVICGRPVFDASIPRSRRYLRYLTHAMVWLNTLSFDIPDSMCGLRVYPLSIVLPAIEAKPPGSRMDFDVEVLVRLHWMGVSMRWIPTRVRYATDGISHFRLVRDNWLITVMHTRLFFGMLRRAPRLVARRLRAALASTPGVSR